MFMSDGDRDREASDRTARDFDLAPFDGTADGNNPYQSPGVNVATGEDEHDNKLDFRRAKRKIHSGYGNPSGRA
jgi:hypothetical protein